MSLHILKVLKELNQNGAKLEVNNGSLKLKATKPIANELISLLKEHKEELIEFIEKHQTKTSDASLPKITSKSKAFEGNIPLSFSQERLWFLDQLNGSVEYHVPFMLNLEGSLKTEALEQSIRAIIIRHEILRTVVISEDGVPFQKVIDCDEWRMLQKETSLIDSQKDVEDFTKTPFDLSTDFMLKTCLFSISENHHILVCLFHHIVSDAWSSGIFMNELSELYHNFSNNKPTTLSPLDIQYSDYAIWLRNHVEGTLLDKQINYWKSKLENVNNLLLPTDFPRPAIQSKNGAGTSLELDESLSKDILQLCQKEDVTLFILMLSAFKILMSRYSNQKDICIGSPIANRTHAELEGLIGFFTNTLAFRSNLDGNPKFKDFLQSVKQTTLEGYDHQLAPFEKIVDSVSNQRDLSMSPLFQVMLVINNTPEGNKGPKLGNLKVSDYTIDRESSKFDLTLLIFNKNEQLTLGMEYCSDLFKESTAQQMLKNFKELLKSISENIELPIENLNILEASEKTISRDTFNQNLP